MGTNKLSIFIKWKLALALVGTEFHHQNLKNNHKKKLRQHFDVNRPLQSELVELLNVYYQNSTALINSPKVLDIGAGPISKVGKVYQSKAIELTPIDPIASKYNKLHRSLNLKPPVPTIYGQGETLTNQFNENQFDLIHARNCIDHCCNPARVILQAIRVLKPNGFFYLNHYKNEGVAAGYYGLHQWNFFENEKLFYLKGRDNEIINISLHIKKLAIIHSINTDHDRIIVVIQKLGSS
jgi:SAM-dependent methyltransferase